LLGVGIGPSKPASRVQSSYQQIGGNNPDQAAQDISLYPAPAWRRRGTTDGLVYPFDFPDPT